MKTGQWVALGLSHAMVSSLVFVESPVPRLLVGMQPRADEQTDAAVFATEDAGATWKPWDGGLAARFGFRAWAHSLASDPLNPERLFMGQSGSILRSEDAGVTWQYVLGNQDLQGLGINSIVVSPRNDRGLWAGCQAAFFAAVVLHSRDSGQTWTTYYPTPNGDDAVFALALDPSVQGRLWAGMAGSVKRSDDAGATWRTVLTPRNPALVASVAFIGGTLYAAAVEEVWYSSNTPSYVLGFYRTADAAQSWDTLQVPPNALGAGAVSVTERGQLLIGTRSGVWRLVP